MIIGLGLFRAYKKKSFSDMRHFATGQVFGHFASSKGTEHPFIGCDSIMSYFQFTDVQMSHLQLNEDRSEILKKTQIVIVHNKSVTGQNQLYKHPDIAIYSNPIDEEVEAFHIRPYN